MLEAVILDIDGTLVLSNDAHARAWADALREFGYEIPFEKIKPLIGMGGDKLLATLIPGMSDKEGVGKEVTERRKEIFRARFAPNLKPAPGSRALVLKMRDEGLEQIVASSAKSDELETLMKAAQVDDLISRRITSDDAHESKPAPDIVAVALKTIGKEPEEAIMLGDTPYDIEAAQKVGVAVIAFRCGGHPDKDLVGALAIFDDPADLLAHYDSSPLSRRATLTGSGRTLAP